MLFQPLIKQLDFLSLWFIFDIWYHYLLELKLIDFWHHLVKLMYPSIIIWRQLIIISIVLGLLLILGFFSLVFQFPYHDQQDLSSIYHFLLLIPLVVCRQVCFLNLLIFFEDLWFLYLCCGCRDPCLWFGYPSPF